MRYIAAITNIGGQQEIERLVIFVKLCLLKVYRFDQGQKCFASIQLHFGSVWKREDQQK